MFSPSFLVVLIAAIFSVVSSFYIPGVAPKEFSDGENIDVKVNSLTSADVFVPYDFYSLPFCQPSPIVSAAENLGEILQGNRIENSLYKMQMGFSTTCNSLCPPRLYTPTELDQFALRIKEKYHANMIVDNMPAISIVRFTNSQDVEVETVAKGFPIGAVYETEEGSDAKEEDVILYNHLKITIKFHEAPEYPGKRIVEFEVFPESLKHKNLNLASATPLTSCVGEDVLYIAGPSRLSTESLPIAWTYDVAFVASDVKWASRWDVYLHMDSNLMDTDKVHWISIVNSLLIVTFLTGMIALILTRTLNKDFSRYNKVPTDEEKAELAEETGWKLVHADVFRPPVYPLFFCVAMGTGVQLLSMMLITIICACFGFLSPANRGSLMITVIVLFVLMSIPAGYVGAKMYRTFGGTMWHRATLLTAVGFPGVMFGAFFIVNLMLWIDGSVGAIPFGSMFAVLAIWLGVSVPLCFLGSIRGYNQEPMTFPVSTSSIPKDIPVQPWYMSTLFCGMIAGVLPFGGVLVELFFILESMWMDRVYYVFGFLLLVFLILIVTCVEISIVICYFQLCSEDYRWWWRSMITPGFSAIYLWLYSLWFFWTRHTTPVFVSTVVYFVYMTLISFSFFIATGTIGIISCLIFTRGIYGAIKVD